MPINKKLRAVRVSLLIGFGFCTLSNAVWAEEGGIDLKFLYTGEEWYNASGGAKRASMNVNNFDVQLAVDGEKEFGWNGATFLLDGLYNNGRTPDHLTGASQQVSPINATGPQIVRLYQAWYNQDFYEGRTSVLVGLYDLHSEFGVLDSSLLFFNSGNSWNTAINQSGRAGPSVFPNTSLSLRVREKFGDTQAWTLQAAVLDGVPDDPKNPKHNTIHINHKNGAFLVGEGSYRPDDSFKAMLGYWRYTAKFDDLLVLDGSGNPRQDSDNQGAYAGVQQRLYTLSEKRTVTGFISGGIANDDINHFGETLNIGVNMNGPFKSREADQVGFAWNLAHNGDSYSHLT